VHDELLAPTMRRALLAKTMAEPSREGCCHDCWQGAPHGLTATLQDQFNADLLAFLRS
jgi:hypothetical protein